MKTVAKSDFAGLVRYLCNAQHKEERLGWIAVTNCRSTTPDAAAREVLATQARNTRAKSDRTYHLIVSFRPGEQVEEATCRAIEARLCAGLGLGAHQRISALHHDTDSLHLHIAINKIHPTRYTIHNPYYDHPKLGQLCTALEHEYHLQPDNHCPRQHGAACRAADMERHGGLESLLGWIRRGCQHQILAARSWADLHCILHANGLSLRERGTGLVVVAANGHAVKANSIDPTCSKQQLERRYGEYAPPATSRAPEPPVRTYEKKPLPCRMDTGALYARYQEAQQQASARGAAERAAIRAGKARQIEAVKQRARLQRASIKLLTAPGLVRRMLIQATNRTLRNQIDHVYAACRRQQEAVRQQCLRCSWVDWLRAQAVAGDRDALAALRARARTKGTPALPGNSMTGVKRVTAVRAPVACDGITKNGTVIYRCGSTAVRDDGDKLTVSRGATPDGLQAALRMAILHFGPLLQVNGTAEFREQIVQAAVRARLAVRFDDVLLEHRRRAQLQHGVIPPGGRYHSEASGRQQSVRNHLDGKASAVAPNATGRRRGSGGQRHGP